MKGFLHVLDNDVFPRLQRLVAIFSYGFSDAVARFEEAKCPMEVLTDYPTMLEQAQAEGYITEEQSKLLAAWSSDPVAWSDERQKA